MTEKLYYQGMYLKEATAEVVEIIDDKVILDRTIFFPEGGGQVGDCGSIDGFKVIDTQKQITKHTRALYHKDFPVIQVDTDVAHILEDKNVSLPIGKSVALKIDWDRRYKIMRMHSASHIAYHFACKIFGDMHLKGCNIGHGRSRFDFSLPNNEKLQRELLDKVEDLGNDFISKNFDIYCEPLADEPEALFWICQEIKMPCGGMHVKNTSEIGKLSLKRKSQGKTIDRMYVSID